MTCIKIMDKVLMNSLWRRMPMLRCVQCRFKSKSYSDTLNLPKTAFPLSMKDGIAPRREADIQKVCEFDKLYDWQRSQERDKKFVLHDGPPYANGDLHVGHAVNKILKDITNRYKVLQGYEVHYVPGWDCHGMPIEQKALAELRMDHTEMKPMDIRKTARKFAEKTIKKHRRSFQRWGIMADWEKGYYATLDKHFEVNQLEVFFQMYNKGFVYQDFMPVYWSPSSRSALAEAELEYKDSHVSTAVYAKFPIHQISKDLQQLIGSEDKAYVLIWTTTPWTLPCNQAVCYGPALKYSLVRNTSTSEVYLVCSEFVDQLKELLKQDITVLSSFPGHSLEGSSYHHPVWTERSLPLLPAAHVTKARGTGLVHTAPAHGPEDFQVAVKHGLSVECHVNEDGQYMDTMPGELAGKLVTDEGNKAALSLLHEYIIHSEEHVHSYPYDWRTKQPVIFRASKQWFVNTANIKQKALASLGDVSLHPPACARGMIAQLDMRTYWCISRQRVWGVPIPTFYNTDTQEVLLSRHSIEHLKQLFAKHGSDCWWTLPLEDLLPQTVIEKSGHDPNGVFAKSDDILDIWFDSGCSWATLLKGAAGSPKQADVYLEGLDQFGGWFQSSLLTSVAVNNQAPYKSLVVHGFAVDEEGKKMSKSLGNVVDPNLVITGGKDKKLQPGYGADVLRWWAAHADLDPVVNIGPSVLDRCSKQVFKVRKSLRYLMGNLDGFDASEAVAVEDLSLPDRHMLHLLHQLITQVTESYEAYNYARVVNLLEKFITTHVSSHYCHITKHRLYCSPESSIGRRSCQSVLYETLQTITVLLAPIVPHLSEEVSLYPPLEGSSVMKSEWPVAPSAWHCPSLPHTMDVAFTLRDTFFHAISSMNPIQFDLVVCASGDLFSQIKLLQPDDLTSSESSLTELLQCSNTSVLSRPPLVMPDESQPVEGKCSFVAKDGKEKESKFVLVILPAEPFVCVRCRRHTAEQYNKPCSGCLEVLASGWES